MGNTGFGSIEEFKGMIISSGGEVDCKIVTPAEDIAALSNKALMAPIEKLQGAVDNLMSKMGTGMGGVLKPYVMAISATVLNDLLQREKGLVASVFTRPPKSRKISGKIPELCSQMLCSPNLQARQPDLSMIFGVFC